MGRQMKISKKEDIVNFLREKKLSEDKITHSIEVAELAVRIADEIEKSGTAIDKTVTFVGGLLHDVGIGVFGDRDYEAEMEKPIPQHCAIGAQIAKNAGFSDEVAHCIESHELWLGDEAKVCNFPEPIKNDYIPKTWEAKAVAYADIVVFAATEEGHDLWQNDKAIIETYYPYFKKCFSNATGTVINENHPSLQRINNFHKEMFKFLKPEYIPKPWRVFKKQTL